MHQRGRPPYPSILTPREREVLDLVREGLTNPQIAERLGISVAGARYHVSEILSKLNVGSREEAAAWLEQERRPSRLSGLLIWPVARRAALLKVGIASAGLAGAVVLVVLFLAAINSRNASTVGPLGKIVYIQDGNVWTKVLPDGRPKQLTHDGGDWHPSWSASGQWLLYVHAAPPANGIGAGTSDIYVMKPDGSERRHVDSTYSGAAWLPGTDRLFYYSQSFAIVMEDAGGFNRSEVPIRSQAGATQEGTVAAPLLSPDGKWLAYIDERWPAGSPQPMLDNPTAEPWSYVGLWIVGTDGSGAMELLNLGGQTGEMIYPAAWTPNDASVLFGVLPAGADSLTLQDGLPLREVSLNGGPPMDLGITTLFLPTDASPAPAPDGSALALVVGGMQETWTNKRIAVLGRNGTIDELTDAGTTALAPAWSPDGSVIAYVAGADLGADGRDASLASRRIWLMAADGTNQRQLTTGQGFRDERPQWSEDGTHILFARLSTEPCDSSQYSLWLLDVRDGSLKQVATGLPLLSTRNARLVVDQVPQCQTHTFPGWVTDWMGRLSLDAVLDWWQPTPNSEPDP